MNEQRSTWFMASLLALAACGGHSAATPDATAPDAMPDAYVFAEAPHPSQPIVQSAGGSVLAAPKVVPVFFAGDTTVQARLESFLAMFPSSSYWSAIASEYGVGAITIAPSVVATETPPTTDDALQALITSHAGGTGGWPANDANTIYTVFLPDGVVLTAGGATSCQSFGGYHDETTAGVVYALVPRCSSATFPDLEEVTFATSHELLEASTDPHPESTPAYASVDDDDAIWGLTPGGELGDMCETALSSFQPLFGQFWVQRTWSNASAAAGHDPCVPALATPYVEAATNLPEITLDVGGGQMLTTRGVKIAVGASATVEVDLYSDAPAPDWTVQAIDVASKYQGSSPDLSFSFDKSTGNNGDKLMLTITRLKAGQFDGISELGLASQVNGITVGTWFALID
jgi:hypothetical protein